ncbi:MAG: DNA gyrase modulator [Candidatus Bathyarchaeia archaeon]|nr:DNA gyrase modulator [Candidatus Bathyarchaeia archaeon]
MSEILNEILTVKNGEPEAVNLLQTKGFGVRVIANGAWGFAGSVDINKEEIIKTVEKAVNIAKASALLKRKETALIREEAREDQYSSSYQKDPFKIPVEEKLDVLIQAGRILKEQSPLIKAAYTLSWI